MVIKDLDAFLFGVGINPSKDSIVLLFNSLLTTSDDDETAIAVTRFSKLLAVKSICGTDMIVLSVITLPVLSFDHSEAVKC